MKLKSNKLIKTILIIIAYCNLSSCSSLFNHTHVTPIGNPYLTKIVRPSFYNTATYGDILLSLTSTRESLTICNLKLSSIKSLNDKNQDI
jgi:hypothetical protein